MAGVVCLVPGFLRQLSRCVGEVGILGYLRLGFVGFVCLLGVFDVRLVGWLVCVVYCLRFVVEGLF